MKYGLVGLFGHQHEIMMLEIMCGICVGGHGCGMRLM